MSRTCSSVRCTLLRSPLSLTCTVAYTANLFFFTCNKRALQIYDVTAGVQNNRIQTVICCLDSLAPNCVGTEELHILVMCWNREALQLSLFVLWLAHHHHPLCILLFSTYICPLLPLLHTLPCHAFVSFATPIYHCHTLLIDHTLSSLSIVSFGAPSPNEYRLVIEGQAPVALKTTQVSSWRWWLS